MKAGKWEKKKFQGMELFNRTLGVIGAGNIGRIVVLPAPRASACGDRVPIPISPPSGAAKLEVEQVDASTSC